MNFNNPDAKPVGISPISYLIEEYEPAGMSGIFILEATLDVGIDYTSNEPYVSDISFPQLDGGTAMIPSEFIQNLIRVIHADKNLMDSISEECADAYSNNR